MKSVEQTILREFRRRNKSTLAKNHEDGQEVHIEWELDRASGYLKPSFRIHIRAKASTFEIVYR